MGTGDTLTGADRPGCEADQSPPSSAEVRNEWSYNSTPPTASYSMGIGVISEGYSGRGVKLSIHHLQPRLIIRRPIPLPTYTPSLKLLYTARVSTQHIASLL